VNLELRALSINDEEAFNKGLELFSDMDADWYSFLYKEGMPFKEQLKLLEDNFHGRNLKEGRVPDSMLYAFLDGVVVGRSSIRHSLNDFLLNRGGNIGYAVATTYRNRGIATQIIKLSLDYCKNVLKLKKVLITCGEANVGSYKAIEKNGGILENILSFPDEEEKVRRYWIEIN